MAKNILEEAFPAASLAEDATEAGTTVISAGEEAAIESLGTLRSRRAGEFLEYVFARGLGNVSGSAGEARSQLSNPVVEQQAERVYLARSLLFAFLRLGIPDVLERSDVMAAHFLGDPERRLPDPWALAALGASWAREGIDVVEFVHASVRG